MSKYLRDQANKHEVRYLDRGQDKHWFEVTSGNSGDRYPVAVSIGCPCQFKTSDKNADKKMCSHALAVADWISKRDGDLTGITE